MSSIDHMRSWLKQPRWHNSQMDITSYNSSYVRWQSNNEPRFSHESSNNMAGSKSSNQANRPISPNHTANHRAGYKSSNHTTGYIPSSYTTSSSSTGVHGGFWKAIRLTSGETNQKKKGTKHRQEHVKAIKQKICDTSKTLQSMPEDSQVTQFNRVRYSNTDADFGFPVIRNQNIENNKQSFSVSNGVKRKRQSKPKTNGTKVLQNDCNHKGITSKVDSYDTPYYHHSLCRERTFDGQIALLRSLYRTSTSYEAQMRRIKKKEASVRRLQFSNNAGSAPETSLQRLQLSDDVTSSPKTSIRCLPIYNTYHSGQSAQNVATLPEGNSRSSSINTLSPEQDCSNTTTPNGNLTLGSHLHHDHEHIGSAVEQGAQRDTKLLHPRFAETSPERVISRQGSSSNISHNIHHAPQLQLAQSTNIDKFPQTKPNSLPIIVSPQTTKSKEGQNSVDVDGYLIPNWGYRSPCDLGSNSPDTDQDYTREMYNETLISWANIVIADCPSCNVHLNSISC